MEAVSTLLYKTPNFHGLTQARANSLRISSTPPMAFLNFSCKFPSGFSKSHLADLRSSFSSSQFGGFLSRQRTHFAVYATAATDKSIHDFNVKLLYHGPFLVGPPGGRFGFAIQPRALCAPSLINGPDLAHVCCKALANLTQDIDGKDVSLSKFKGKVLLIVNVASKCGLTTSNYSELSHVYEKYKTQGFEILAFPCNQFGGQEPGSNPEIKQFACTRFKAEFPIFDKVDVNGPNTAPVYQFLKSSAGGFLGDLVKWNFEKFLVDKNGKVVERYPPTTTPFQIEKDIQKLLAAA